MIEIHLENGKIIPLYRKSILILSSGFKNSHIINNEDNYDVIMIIAGIDRKVNIELHQPAIVILEGCIRTVVNVTGGMALPISQAVINGGMNNTINGLAKQNNGRLITSLGEKIDLTEIATFDKIEIGR